VNRIDEQHPLEEPGEPRQRHVAQEPRAQHDDRAPTLAQGRGVGDDGMTARFVSRPGVALAQGARSQRDRVAHQAEATKTSARMRRGVQERLPDHSCSRPLEPVKLVAVEPPRDIRRAFDMMKGGLLWLIGIPLPIIILIALFTNWLS
jgi:hypothetical protein